VKAKATKAHHRGMEQIDGAGQFSSLARVPTQSQQQPQPRVTKRCKKAVEEDESISASSSTGSTIALPTSMRRGACEWD
jgi:hypothetical protein